MGVIQAFSEDRGLGFLKCEDLGDETLKFKKAKTPEYQNNED